MAMAEASFDRADLPISVWAAWWCRDQGPAAAARAAVDVR